MTKNRIQQTLIIIAGCLLTLLGLIGLLLPVAPGLLFLAAAAFCFASVSARFRKHLDAHPRVGPYARRWAAAAHLPALKKLKFGLLLAWAGIADTLGRRGQTNPRPSRS